MRVLHVIPSIGPLRGGPSVAMGVIARALRDAGVHVEVATTNDNDRALLDVPTGEAVTEDGIRYWYFPRSTHPYTTSTGLARWLRRQVAAYDIVHIHALFSFATSAAAAAARRSAVPYIVRPLGSLAPYGMQQHAWIKTISWLLLERGILKHAAAVHFTSDAERTEAERLGNWRGVVVPLGVEPLPLPQQAKPEQPPVFLFLSRIDVKKRVSMLLQAFAELRSERPDARLLIAGDGDAAYLAQLAEQTRELSIERAVEWMGHVTGAAKSEVLARAHALVLPSINENFGIAAVEAMSAGLPVVLTRGVAIHREVEQAGAGLVVADDVASLAAGMRGMLDVAERQRMANAALTLARETFSVKAMQNGLLELYERVLAR